MRSYCRCSSFYYLCRTQIVCFELDWKWQIIDNFISSCTVSKYDKATKSQAQTSESPKAATITTTTTPTATTTTTTRRSTDSKTRSGEKTVENTGSESSKSEDSRMGHRNSASGSKQRVFNGLNQEVGTPIVIWQPHKTTVSTNYTLWVSEN